MVVDQGAQLMSGCIEVNNVCLHRGSRAVLRRISMKLNTGEVLGVLGPNGAGKSSFLGVCCAELPVQSGYISFDGLDVAKASPLTLARTRAVLPQHATMSFDLPISEVVAMGAYPFPEVSDRQVNNWVRQAISLIDLGGRAQDSYRALSGGEQQRVQFARVLVQTWAIASHQGRAYLFLDEPTASLDPKHQVLLMRLVRDVARNLETAVIVVLHDLNLAARWCDHLMLMANGAIEAFDERERVLDEALLERVYGLSLKVRPHPVHADRLIVLEDG